MYYEFFCGGGMARLGFGPRAICLFANDLNAMKCAAYRRNCGDGDLREGDINLLSTADLPGVAAVAWASSPCQDLSVAGAGAGLGGERSGLLFKFLWLMAGLRAEGRGPKMIVIENVTGLATLHGGHDLVTIVIALSGMGYRVGALEANAKLFLPQSRARLFIIAIRDDVDVGASLAASEPQKSWHPPYLKRVFTLLPARSQARWNWWTLPAAAPRTTTLADIVDRETKDVPWDDMIETRRRLSMMATRHREKVEAAQRSGMPKVGAMSQRTRLEGGKRVQRMEIRFDGLAGCLLAPKGGSSVQRLLLVDGDSIRSRRLSPREAARLMGLPDKYELPPDYMDAMRLIGDGVAVPVVEYLVRHIIRPIIFGAVPMELAA
jgi:DNA (cytosine-5)-methyltransferase 1